MTLSIQPLPETPDVSIVLPIRNEESFIEDCLERLLLQDYPPSHVEILVVDGQSTDATRDVVQSVIAAHPERTITLLENPRRIVPTALNIGIRAARGHVVLRMDGHTVPEPDYVTACVRALKATGAANVGGRLQPRGTTTFGRAVAVAQSHPAGAGDAKFHFASEPEYVDTVYMGAFRKDVFRHAGMFDESMVRNQDYEMNVRIRAAGGSIYLDPEIRSTYTPRGSLEALARQYFEYGWWRVVTWRRHPASLRWRQAVPAVFVLMLALLAILAPFAATARFLLAAQVVAYGLFLGLATFHARPRMQAADAPLGLFPLAVATIHLAWGAGFAVNLTTAGRFPFRASRPAIPEMHAEPEAAHPSVV